MKLTDIKNSLNEISAIGGLKQVVKGNTDRVEGIKLSKEMAQAMIDWFNSSPYGRKYPNAKKGRLNLSLGIMGHFGLDRYAKHKGAKEELKYIKTLSKAMRDNVNESKFAGWIAGYNGKQIEIKKGEAKDLYNAKLLAIKKLKVPKSKVGLMFIKPAVDESVVNEAKYDIGMARKGNGLTIYNKAEEEKGDYKNVAHIDNKGKIKYYDKKVPSKIKKQIEAEAKKMMEIKIEGTMKLTDLLSEDVYVKNKKTGNTYQVKNADPSKHVPPSKDDIEKAKSDAKDEPNRNPSKEEPKKDEPKNDGPKVELSKDFDKLYYADDIESEIEKLEGKISDEDYKKLIGQTEDLKYAQMDAEEAENYDSPEEAEEDGLDVRPKEELEKMASDLKDMIRQTNGTPKEEPKSEPKKDEPKSEPKRVPLDKNDSYYIKTAVEKKMGPAAFKALSYGDMQKAYNDEMESRGWEKGDDGEWTKPANESSKRKIKESKGNTMKLKNILKESFESGRVYSNPFHTPFVKENDDERHEESAEMSNEQKMAFLEAVKSYKKFGESIYRKEGLAKVYESIRGLVEIAGKNMVKETEGSFDGITVGRHVKRMNESFKVFEKTLKEVGTLQQRLESTYDEIGEVLGKYYEINELEEGNEFGAARAKAIANGDSEFEVDGKKYPVKGVDKKDKENAKEFTNESKSIKLTSLLNESFGYGELPSSKLMKMKVSAKEMLDSVKNKKVNEAEVVEEEKINEGFSTWEMRFSDMNLGGVKLSKKNVYKVKARNTVEAIKKAAKMAGVEKNWIATETHSLKKIG
jgi:hypothetical protein